MHNTYIHTDLTGDFQTWSREIVQWMASNPSILLICLVLGAAPAAFWGWMWYRKIEMDDDHRRLMYRTFFLGMFAIFPVYIINYTTSQLLNFDLIDFIKTQSVAGSTILIFLGYVLIGVYEEYSKFFIVREVDYKQRAFNRIVDGIEFAIAAALGFAFMENMLYFISALREMPVSSKEFSSIIIFRSLGSMLAHTLFSGIFGYYYGQAKFVGIPVAEHGESLSVYNLYNGVRVRALRLKQLLKGEQFHRSLQLKLKEEELIAEGLFIAVMLHGIYNYLINIDQTIFIVPLIVMEYAIIVHELHVHRNLEVHVT